MTDKVRTIEAGVKLDAIYCFHQIWAGQFAPKRLPLKREFHPMETNKINTNENEESRELEQLKCYQRLLLLSFLFPTELLYQFNVISENAYQRSKLNLSRMVSIDLIDSEFFQSENICSLWRGFGGGGGGSLNRIALNLVIKRLTFPYRLTNSEFNAVRGQRVVRCLFHCNHTPIITFKLLECWWHM